MIQRMFLQSLVAGRVPAADKPEQVCQPIGDQIDIPAEARDWHRLIAVAHRILTIAWHIIAEGSTYYELEGNGGDRQQTARIARRLARRLEQLGFEVEIKSRTNAQPPPPPSHQTTGPTTSPTDPVVCRRCARWGIPCIHAKNARWVRSATPALPTNQQLR